MLCADPDPQRPYRVGWKHGIALTPPGPRLQLYRKLARQFLGPQVISGYSLFVESEMRAFVSRMLIGSRDFMNEFKLCETSKFIQCLSHSMRIVRVAVLLTLSLTSLTESRRRVRKTLCVPRGAL